VNVRPALLAVLAALTLAPREGVARSLREIVDEAEAARERGALEDALEFLREAYQIEPNPIFQHNMGRIQEELGRYGEALATYKKVIERSKDKKLTAQDAARVRELETKLDSAWLAGNPSSPDVDVVVDGVTLGSEEHRFSPENHLVELTRQGRPEVVVRLSRFPSGERSVLSPDTIGRRGDDGRLTLTGVAPIERFEIEGHPLHRALLTSDVLLLRPGTYRCSVTLSGQVAARSVMVELGGQEERSLGQLLRVPAPDVVAAEPPSVAPEAISGRPAPPPRKLWPAWVAGGLALVSVGIGALCLVEAFDLRSRVTNAKTDQAGDIISITEVEAERAQDTANVASVIGWSAVGAGAALAAASLWWTLSD
jgi:hypothetical protein